MTASAPETVTTTVRDAPPAWWSPGWSRGQGLGSLTAPRSPVGYTATWAHSVVFANSQAIAIGRMSDPTHVWYRWPSCLGEEGYSHLVRVIEQDCEDYQTRYRPEPELRVLADWVDENADRWVTRKLDGVVEGEPFENMRRIPAGISDDLRGGDMFSERRWKEAVLPKASVHWVKLAAYYLGWHEELGRWEDEDARLVFVEAENWLDAGRGMSFMVGCCDGCMRAIVSANFGDGEPLDQSEADRMALLRKVWPDHKLTLGWRHDPNHHVLLENEWSSSRCDICGQYEDGERTKVSGEWSPRNP